MKKQADFCKNLNNLLDIRCINQVDVANALNISRSTVSRWCDGSSFPKGKTVIALAEYLCVTPSMLTGIRSTVAQFDEETLLHYFRMLSPKGKEKALERMQELTQLYWYSNDSVAK